MEAGPGQVGLGASVKKCATLPPAHGGRRGLWASRCARSEGEGRLPCQNWAAWLSGDRHRHVPSWGSTVLGLCYSSLVVPELTWPPSAVRAVGVEDKEHFGLDGRPGSQR